MAKQGWLCHKSWHIQSNQGLQTREVPAVTNSITVDYICETVRLPIVLPVPAGPVEIGLRLGIMRPTRAVVAAPECGPGVILPSYRGRKTQATCCAQEFNGTSVPNAADGGHGRSEVPARSNHGVCQGRHRSSARQLTGARATLALRSRPKVELHVHPAELRDAYAGHVDARRHATP